MPSIEVLQAEGPELNLSIHRPIPIAIASRAIAPPSHAKMPLLGRKFPAQIGTSKEFARWRSWELEQMLTKRSLQPSQCGPSTSPVRRELQSKARKKAG
jgi:hypothetical protein